MELWWHDRHEESPPPLPWTWEAMQMCLGRYGELARLPFDGSPLNVDNVTAVALIQETWRTLDYFRRTNEPKYKWTEADSQFFGWLEEGKESDEYETFVRWLEHL